MRWNVRGAYAYKFLDRQIDEYIQPIDQQACARCELTQDNWVDPEGGEKVGQLITWFGSVSPIWRSDGEATRWRMA